MCEYEGGTMSLDKRTRLYKRQQATLKSWGIFSATMLFVTIGAGLAIASTKPIVMVSPLSEQSQEVPLVQEDALIQPSDALEETRELTVEEKIMNAWGPNEGPRAWKIVSECENKGLNLEAVNWNSNGTWDAGLFQINQVHGYSMEHLFDVDNNISAAYKIYQASGWSAWSCSHVINETPFYML